jgi:release factor glutamine methyltransferase
MTVFQATAAAAEVLTGAGFGPEDARRDASVLARHVLGWTLADWGARSRDTAPAGFREQLAALAHRRATREPVAYITGVRAFYGREFQVSPAVLIPRPETEGVIEAALSIVAGITNHEEHEEREELTLVDVGTGSGCLAVTLALEIPGSQVMASDISSAALTVARANAERLGARVEFVEASLIPAGVVADVIVSNPPYVPERDRDSLSPDVRDFEPAGALFAGPDGLDVIRQLVPAARHALRPGGWLVMEIGAGQADAVADIARTAGLALDRIAPDLQGIPRVVVARRP